MERIAKFAAGLITNLEKRGEKPAYVVVERPKDTGSRANMRVSLGTIPDYSTGELEGVKLSGVRAGGPADLAGSRAGT